MPKMEDLTGRTFGNLTVLKFAGLNKHQRSTWECLCECGNTKIIAALELKAGQKTCGCVKRKLGFGFPIHNATGSVLYHAWISMKMRCGNPNDRRYADYGGRGIKVCDRWINSFENFRDDMGERPTADHSLDRIDVAGDYMPENCRWATRAEQMRNTRRSWKLPIDGKMVPVQEAALVLGISATTLKDRLRSGWSPERTVSTPLLSNRKN